MSPSGLLICAVLLSLCLLSALPFSLSKKGHPKEHQHGDGRHSRNSSFYLALTRRQSPHHPTPSLSSATSLSSFSSSHAHLSSLLPRIASTGPPSNGPPRSLEVDTSHFHALHQSPTPSHPTLVNLTDSFHVMYTASLTIGTPPQSFHMILDTGSSCLWAISGRASSARQLPPFLHSYDHSASSTYTPDGTPWDIQYGVGQCRGFFSRDTVALTPHLRVRNQSLAEAVELSANFLNPQQPLDGIVGMSFAGGACQGEETFVEGLYREGRIARRVFSFHLDRAEGEAEMNEVAIGEEEGEGTGDERVVYTDVLHAPHRAPAMWFVHLEALAIRYPKGASPVHNHSAAASHDSEDRRGRRRGSRVEGEAAREREEEKGRGDEERGEERREASRRLREFIAAHHADAPVSSPTSDGLSFCGPSTGPCIALPDTGTSFLTLPTRLFILLVSVITHGRDDCIIDALSNVFCLDNPHTLPSLQFTFSGRAFVLTPRDYMLPNKQLAIQVLDFGVQEVHIVILGDVFLRKVRVVFDEEEWRVGFVHTKGEEDDGGVGEEEWLGREGEEMGMGGVWVALLLLGLMCAICCVCGCVCYDWCLKRRNRADYEPIAAAA